MDDKRFRTKRIETLREYIYIYIIYTLDVLYIVPTVFLGLNKGRSGHAIGTDSPPQFLLAT